MSLELTDRQSPADFTPIIPELSDSRVVETTSLFSILSLKIYLILVSKLNDMIEVIAEILRGPVFLAGETLHCQITLTNQITNENDSNGSQ